MPNISQQDYIIIDWEGKDSSDAEKLAEVKAILKPMYEDNPLTLFSVIFAHYDDEVTLYDRIISIYNGSIVFYSASSSEYVSIYLY